MWYFEMCDMIHKLALTSLIAFVKTKYQMPLAMGIVALYTVVILVGKPYLSKGSDRLHLLAQTELLLVLMAGHCFRENVPLDAISSALASTLLILLCIFFALFLIITTFREMQKIWAGSKLSVKVNEFINSCLMSTRFGRTYLKKKNLKKDSVMKPEEMFYENIQTSINWSDGKKSNAEGIKFSRNPINKVNNQTTFSDANYDEVEGRQQFMKVNPFCISETKVVETTELDNVAIEPKVSVTSQKETSPFDRKRLNSSPLPSLRSPQIQSHALEQRLITEVQPDSLLDLDDIEGDEGDIISSRPKKKKVPTAWPLV
eukprot:TRINITY_DN5007_c0_g1_i2.p1 TRINITY_DN5007_c0_g1~~TRINITY_DN5007_c0_g1_i2.p1  ORF type:complete len:316 (-),score=42.57 TRINITY_DN5007_c0_g1_i2:28-975(-)